MNNILFIIELLSGIVALVSGFYVFLSWTKKLVEGQKCQLRQEMLSTYYKHRDEKQIRQYALENFTMMYKAYKALNGNSFIDIIYNEVTEWEILP